MPMISKLVSDLPHRSRTLTCGGLLPWDLLQNREPSQIWLQKPCCHSQGPLGLCEQGRPGQLWPLKDLTGRKLSVLGNPWVAPF